MTAQEFREILSQTLDDQRLSRGERKALKSVLKDMRPAQTELDVYRHEAFDLVRETLPTALDKGAVIDWLEDVIRTLRPAEEKGHVVETEAYFSPGNRCRSRIRSLLRQSRNAVDICVFTITDDEISEVIAETHNRGIAVRIITDDEKSSDTGSDIERLASIGIEVAIDNSPYHMHHKFALFDESILLCGSYNWTRSAADHNEENIVITNDDHLVDSFHKLFQDMWIRYR
ncbi:phospholipase D-like domain-containing protein [Thalassoglobus sp. JC818]|uniref:phospholipase D-like domain-containing protein n=1 Tax=Thalassoglobus sp. JC818 TaxID=3232136 RepID=UPI00345944D7